MIQWTPLVVKNAIFAAFVLAVYLMFDTGYISSDRLGRVDEQRLERLTKKSVGWTEYVSAFDADLLDGRALPAGTWARYNGAQPHHVRIENGALVIDYKEAAWLGAAFTFKIYKPSQAYRVTVQANVENQPGAIVVRNRVQDLKRVELAPSGGQWQEYATTFMSPPGRFDRVYVILMPDDPNDPVGRMRVRHIKIDRLID